jgi:hypothetical protein
MDNFDDTYHSVLDFVELGMYEDVRLWDELKGDWEGPAKDFGLTLDHILSASRWSKMTAHKANPNIPMCVVHSACMDIRGHMLDEDLLTDVLPFDEV